MSRIRCVWWNVDNLYPFVAGKSDDYRPGSEAEYQSKLQLADNKQSVDDLKAKGMTVTEIDRADWADKTKDAWKQFQPQITQDLVTKVQQAQ